LLPGDAAVHYNLGRVLRKTGKSNEAAVELSRARELNEKAQATILAKTYNNTATKLMQEGRFEEAAAKLKEALRLDPDNATALGPQKQESSLCSLLHQAVFVVQAPEHRFLCNTETDWQLVSVATGGNFVLRGFR
jgi:tetratricopeptide (TPR) repeat protein